MKPLRACVPLLAVMFLSRAAFGRGLGLPTSGLDVSGSWFNLAAQSDGNSLLVDCGGVPLNEAGRLYVLAWDPSGRAATAMRRIHSAILLHGGGNFRF